MKVKMMDHSILEGAMRMQISNSLESIYIFAQYFVILVAFEDYDLEN